MPGSAGSRAARAAWPAALFAALGSLAVLDLVAASVPAALAALAAGSALVASVWAAYASGAARLGWAIVAAALAMRSVGEIGLAAIWSWEGPLEQSTWIDAVRILAVAALVPAAVAFGPARGLWQSALRLVDAVAFGLVALVAALLADSALVAGAPMRGAGGVAAAAYVVAGAAASWAFVVGLRGHRAGPSDPLPALAIGAATIGTADGMFSWASYRQDESIAGVGVALSMAGSLLVLQAAVTAMFRLSRRGPDEPDAVDVVDRGTGGADSTGWRSFGPYVVAAGLAGLLLVRRTGSESGSDGLTLAAGTALLAIVLRQWLVHAERDRAHRQLLRTRDEFARQAASDPITELPNNRALIRRIGEEVERSRRYHQPLTLCFVDIDSFKQVNDTFGHQVGDEVLRQVGRVLRGNARSIDFVGRYAGEEFVLVAPGTWTDDGVTLAERVREAVARHMFAGGEGTHIRLTVSIGVAGLPEHAHDRDGLIRCADQALFVAKRSGRNQVRLYDPAFRLGPAGPTTLEAARRLAALVEQRDPDTANHGLAVSRLAGALAAAIGLDPAERGRVEIAGLIHDIGKVAIADAILIKGGSLSESEFEAVRAHPIVGARLLEGVPELVPLAAAVRHHHERWDGRGYPAGLSGEAIPLGARIIALADAYHAMISPRAFRARLSHDEAIAEIRRHAGTQFDPRLVEPFLLLARPATVQPDDDLADSVADPERDGDDVAVA